MSDDTLLNEFVEAGNESAFASLVRRHADLVYATARRQVGNEALAQEITQNVFIALARKSGALRGSITISGWLYRTTLLESRRMLRAELRRQRRETVAFELGQAARTGDSPWASVVPLLDEALTRLREGDRLAVLLRYFEGKPLRDVGQSLGISEDAAQKRVAKSLAELTAFFQRRGFHVSCTGAAGAGLFAEAIVAAPLPVVASATQAGLAAAGGAGLSGLSLIAFKIMNLTKLQTAAMWTAVAVLTAMPIAYEAREWQQTRAANADLAARLAAARQAAADAEGQRDVVAQNLAVARSMVAIPTSAARLQPRTGPATSPAWTDGSPLARIPKELLARAWVNALDNEWKIRPELTSILALSPEKTARLQQAVDGFFAGIGALEEAHMERLPDEPADTAGPGDNPKPGKSRFRIGRYEPEANDVRIRLRDQLREHLGAERTELALRFLDFAPANRPALTPGEPLPKDDYFENRGHTSARWNFHGYERTITLEPPTQPGLSPDFSITVKIGHDHSMSFGGDRHLLNPAVAPSLRAAFKNLDVRPPAETEVVP